MIWGSFYISCYDVSGLIFFIEVGEADQEGFSSLTINFVSNVF